jgi:molybdate transport system substrate-binding protein
VVNGEADAAIVYATDARVAQAGVAAVPVAGPEAVYLIAVVTGTQHRAAAHAFVTHVTGPEGRSVLRARGFRLP